MRIFLLIISLLLVGCNIETPERGATFLKCGNEWIILDLRRELWIRTYGERPTREQAPYIDVYNFSTDENSYAVIQNNGKKGSKIDRYTLKMHTSAGDIVECKIQPSSGTLFNEFWEMGLDVSKGKGQPKKQKPKPVRKI